VGALDAFPVPGSANLQAAMVRLSIQIICHSYGFARYVIDNSKRKPIALRLGREPLVNEFD
jgi:hypothetical protein